MDPKTTVESCDRIDFAHVRRLGALAGPPWPRAWQRRIDAHHRLVCVIQGNVFAPKKLAVGIVRFGEPEPQIIAADMFELEPMRCRFGGRRFWLRCPGLSGGEHCGNRVRAIFRPPGSLHFACRECHDLTYESRQSHRNAMYEMAKPIRTAPALADRLRRARSPRRRAHLLRRLERIVDRGEHYKSILLARGRAR